MVALCLLLSFGTIGMMSLLFFESRDNKRLNNVLNDYRDRRYSDQMVLDKMEELIQSQREHYRETVNDYKSIIMKMTDKISNPVEKLKSQATAAKPSIDLKDFSKRIDKQFNNLKDMMSPSEQDVTS